MMSMSGLLLCLLSLSFLFCGTAVAITQDEVIANSCKLEHNETLQEEFKNNVTRPLNVTDMGKQREV